MNENQNPTNPTQNVEPYKEIEFETFLKEIGNANIQNWSILAEALGVNRETIVRWKKHPLAQSAISNAIEESLRKMEQTGSNDWRMYREKLKMLGVKDKSTLEHAAGDDIPELLSILERTDYSKLAKEIVKTQSNP